MATIAIVLLCCKKATDCQKIIFLIRDIFVHVESKIPTRKCYDLF